MEEIRKKSFQQLKSLGFSYNEKLPMLKYTSIEKSRDDIINRSLIVSCLVGLSYSYNKENLLITINWLKGNKLESFMTPLEKEYLIKDNNDKYFQNQVEALYLFSRVLGLTGMITHDKLCPNSLVSFFPKINKLDSFVYFKSRVMLMPYSKILELADFYYCYHDSIINNLYNPKLKIIPEYAIIERKRTLEWLIGNISWDPTSPTSPSM